MNNVKGFTNTRKINQEAAEWLLLIEDTEQLSKQQIEALNHWVNNSEVHRQCLTNMANSWGEMNLLASVMLPQQACAHSKTLGSSQAHTKMDILQAWLLTPVIALVYMLTKLISGCKPLAKALYQIFSKPLIAIPLAIGFVGLLTFTVSKPFISAPDTTYLVTQKGQQTEHLMADGSVIWLNSDSKVEVEYSSRTRRINLIHGEAHFEVKKDPSRPFEVYAGDRLVRAIGTAFSVYRLEDRIEVLVSEGKVELAIVDESLVITPDKYDPIKVANLQLPPSTNTSQELAQHTQQHLDQRLAQQQNTNNGSSQKHSAISSANGPKDYVNKQVLGHLVAGQRVSIPASATQAHMGEVLELDSSEVTRKLSWRQGKLIFAGESLEQVIKEITRHTKIRIDVFDPALKKMRIGGQFQVGETDSLFYVLESGFGISVDKLDEDHVQLHVKNRD